ncbi:carbonic anhydrase [Castellaniella sp.]|uniref:carbonic anhydrase n=1 Tax=Castellaniella sp. TaxID=1955812 RepID=UPI002AFFC4AA|nr:carbonic anhydrase [Castellaniella sp.]
MCDAMSCQQPKVTSRRDFLRATTALSLMTTAGLSGLSPAAWAASPPKPDNVLTPDAAIQRLMEGNQRYASGVRLRHNFTHDRAALAGGQNPYAAILGCADSRVAPEYTFDAGRGDLFIARVAGNFANDDMLGSLEYAVAVLNVPVILVLGHDRCGAVDAAVKAVTQGTHFPGHIQSLANAIAPAVKQAQSQHPTQLLDAAITQNVQDNVASLSTQSAIIRQAQQAGKLKIIGGVYRLDTGKVDFQLKTAS